MALYAPEPSPGIPSEVQQRANAILRNPQCARWTRTLQVLEAKGGPDPEDYDDFNRVLKEVNDEIRAGGLDREDVRVLCSRLGDAFSLETLQGWASAKPFGYAGDYKMIDWIYTHRVSDKPRLKRWDLYFQSQAAPQAVRNRKTYLHKVLDSLEAGGAGCRVLNVGSGPTRCIREWLDRTSTKLRFDCVDIDQRAIRYASELNAAHVDSGQMRFFEGNALRFVPSEKYNLIWSAGLFDYLDDAAFVRLARRYTQFTPPGGEVVIGNFSEANPTRPYMEVIGEWFLNYRSAERLHALASQAGVAAENIRVGQEPEGVNLFLHMRVR